MNTNGQKGLTMINTGRHFDSLKKDMSYLPDKKIVHMLMKSALKKYEKMLLNHDVKKLETIGKTTRKNQAALTKKLAKSYSSLMTDEYESFVKGVTNTKPIADKDKMRRSNIKLGYQVAMAYTTAMRLSVN